MYNNGAEAHEQSRRQIQDLSNSKYYDAIINGPVNMQRRLDCSADFKLFCETYGSAAFTLGWAPCHLEGIKKLEEAFQTSACYSLAFPRGFGKSTLCHWALLWGALCGHVEYAIYVGATAQASATRLSSIKTTLRFNEELYEDFPEIIGPIRFCEGEARKAGGQKFLKQPTEIRWGSDRLHFPTLQGFDAAWYNEVPYNFGSVLDFASLEGNIRGRAIELPSGKVLRPQVAVVDDPQTRESAASPAQVLKREHILKGDIGYLGGPDRPCGVVVPCTVVYEDDLAHRLLDHELNPEFRGSRFAMLPDMPGTGLSEEEETEIMKMWEIDYDEKRRFDLINGTDFSGEFYKENQEKMDNGAKASWPERFSPLSNETSAVQAAMNLFLTDQMSFMCEAQNEPMPLEDRDQIPLTVDDILARGINLPQHKCPTKTEFLTSFIDISRNVLWYATVAWEKDTFKGHIVDYGVWPDQGKHYVTLATAKKTIPDLYKAQEYSVALTRAIDDCVGYILNCCYETEAGAVLYPERIGIDSGWGEESQTVYQYCRRSSQGRLLVSTKGHGSTPARRPLVDPEKKREPNTSLIGQWKFSRNRVGSNLLTYDVNLWKSKVNSLLRLPIESTSGLTLFNAKHRGRSINHRMFAEQMTSERPMWIEGGGRRIETWKNQPGRDNHLLDCVVGASMLAHVCGCKMQTTGTVLSAVGGNTSKVTKAKRRRRRFTQGD